MRPLVPRSVARKLGIIGVDVDVTRAAATKSTHADPAPVCGVNAMCASFGSTRPDVIGWVGFTLEDGGESFFVATHSKPAVEVGGGNYAMPFWDRQHLWVNIDGGQVPLGLQPRYVLTDPVDGEYWTVDYIGYKQAGIDYRRYALEQSISRLVLLIDPVTRKVTESYMEVYDENDDYVHDADIAIGDTIQSFIMGFQRNDGEHVYLFWFEDGKKVSKPPVYFNAELYPGVDFPCGACNTKAKAATVEFHYMFESYGLDRSTFTVPVKIASPATVVEYQNTVDFPHSPGGQYFYTADPAEQAAVDAGAAGKFSRTGRQFRVGGDSLVCRFYGSIAPGPNSHFFTVNVGECSALKSAQVTPRPTTAQQWNYEGVAYAAWSPVAGTNGALTCPANTVPLYRAYNNAFPQTGAKNPWDSNHRFMPVQADVAEMVSKGWRDEGIAYCTPRSA